MTIMTITTPVNAHDDEGQTAMVFPQTVNMPVNAPVDETTQTNERTEMQISINTPVNEQDDEPQTLEQYRNWVESQPIPTPFVDARSGAEVGPWHTETSADPYHEVVAEDIVGGRGGDIPEEWRVSLADDWTTLKTYDSVPYRGGAEMHLWDITIPGSWTSEPTTIMRKEHTIVSIPSVDPEELRVEAGFAKSTGWQERYKVAGMYKDFVQAARAFTADSEEADFFSEAGYAWEQLDEVESAISTDAMRPWWN